MVAISRIPVSMQDAMKCCSMADKLVNRRKGLVSCTELIQKNWLVIDVYGLFFWE